MTVGARPPLGDGKKCTVSFVPSNEATVVSRARAGAAQKSAAGSMQAKAQEIRLMGPTVVALTRCAAVFDLSGHVAVVTGGNSGIGLGMADGLARAGADVCIWGRRAERNDEARTKLAVHGTKVHAIVVDVSDADAVDAAFDETVAALGGVDSCFANAGVGSGGVPFIEMSLDEFRRVTRVNLEGAFLTLQGAARRMIERGGGSLVGVASLAAIEGQPRGQHYAASKGGLVSMIRACAVELARHGIRANAILPGWIETRMTDGFLDNEPVIDRILKRVPARRWGKPEDFAGAAVYLASPLSSYQSGDALIIDGGYRVF